MMKIISILIFMLFSAFANAQILHVGAKYDRKVTFNTSFNYPFFMEQKKPYEFTLGLDYTSKNKKVPSGLAPQATFGYFIVDSDKDDYLLFGGLTAGYLLDFNRNFDNQFRITPHVYMEILFINIKVGYDYMMPLQKGYPFVSIGFGGFMLFRNFKMIQ